MRDRKASKQPSPDDRDRRSREEVLSEFRKIAGPLRGRNRDEKRKPS
jgi:hypothetical protein